MPSIVQVAPAPGSPRDTSSDCCAVSEPPTSTRSSTTPGTSRRMDHGSEGRGREWMSSASRRVRRSVGGRDKGTEGAAVRTSARPHAARKSREASIRPASLARSPAVATMGDGASGPPPSGERGRPVLRRRLLHRLREMPRGRPGHVRRHRARRVVRLRPTRGRAHPAPRAHGTGRLSDGVDRDGSADERACGHGVVSGGDRGRRLRLRLHRRVLLRRLELPAAAPGRQRPRRLAAGGGAAAGRDRAPRRGEAHVPDPSRRRRRPRALRGRLRVCADPPRGRRGPRHRGRRARGEGNRPRRSRARPRHRPRARAYPRQRGPAGRRHVPVHRRPRVGIGRRRGD